MNYFDAIFKNIEFLVFAAIIIVQIVAAIFAQNKKKQRKAQNSDRNQARQQPQPYKHNKQPPRRQQPKSAPEPHRQAAPAPRANDCEWEKSMMEIEVKAAMKAAAKANAQNTPSEYDYAAPIAREKELTAQARNGFVWLEILRPPVSMR